MSRRGSLLSLAGASGVVAVANFVVMFLGAAHLPTAADQAEFLTFWSLLGGVYGVVYGVQNETTRGVAAVEAGAEVRTSALRPAVVMGALVAAVVCLLLPFLAPLVLPRTGMPVLIALVATAVLYAVQMTVLGGVNGRAWWGTSALLVGGEAILRALAVVVASVLAGSSLLAMELASSAGVLLLPLVLLLPAGRTALRSGTDSTHLQGLRRIGWAMGSAACMTVLLNAYPAVLSALRITDDKVVIAALILTIALTRAPIMMPLTVLQGVAIKAFIARRDHPIAALWSVIRWIVLIGVLGAVAAWFVGPWFLPLVNSTYVLAPWVFSVLTLDSVVMAVLTLLGVAALADSRHRLYVTGWMVASGVSVVLLLLPVSVTVAAAVSLGIGPLVGSAIVLAALSWRGRTRRP